MGELTAESEPASLRTLFARAQHLESSLQSSTSPPNSASHLSTARAALSAYQAAQQATEHVSLFSPNETLEDLSTSDLPYLSINFHIGALLQTASDPARERTEILKESQAAYEEFLLLQSQYALMTAAESRMFERYQGDRDGFSVVGTSEPGARREEKIKKLRAEKELKVRLEALRMDPDVLRGDEEAERGLRLVELELQRGSAFQALDFVGQEARILTSRPAADEWVRDPREIHADHRMRTMGRGAVDGDGYSERLDGDVGRMLRGAGRGGPVLDARGRPLQPFVLMDRRRELRDGVFRPGHRLPTMTIDEYLEEERRRGGIIEGGGEPEEVEPDEDDLEKADQETMKKREWDEFVEENPKGSGNTLNRG